MAPRAKKAKTDPAVAALESSILAAVKTKKQGLTDKELTELLPPGTDQAKRVQAYNLLLTRGKLQLQRRASDREPLYAAASEEVTKLVGLNINERALYQLIADARNKGIWSRDLRNKSNLPKVQLEKALRALESRKLVKTVKSVSQSKKIYMLFNLQPGEELAGGPWFNEQHEYDAECVRVIYKQVQAFVKEKPYMTREEICAKLNSSGILNETLSEDNVEQLLGTMVCDGVLTEYCDTTSDERHDKLEKPKVQYCRSGIPATLNSLTDVPCGVCPVFSGNSAETYHE